MFSPDSRNLGGRNQITNLMYNHQLSLINTKPTIQTRITSPKNPNYQKKQISYKKIMEYNEVFETFRRAGNVKWSKFSSPPKTFYLKDMLSRKNNKAYKYAQFEHHLYLNSQKKRIEDLSNFSQRKKNAFDYTVHPSLFFRRKDDLQETSNYYLKNTENIKNKEGKFDSNQESTEKIEDPLQNQEIIEKPQEENDSNNEENGYILLPIPQIKGKNEQDYKDLKERLIELIYEYRVFKSQDLESLFGRTLLHNKHMDSKRLHVIFKEIQEEFDS